jgi:hypothetical protein
MQQSQPGQHFQALVCEVNTRHVTAHRTIKEHTTRYLTTMIPVRLTYNYQHRKMHEHVGIGNDVSRPKTCDLFARTTHLIQALYHLILVGSSVARRISACWKLSMCHVRTFHDVFLPLNHHLLLLFLRLLCAAALSLSASQCSCNLKL